MGRKSGSLHTLAAAYEDDRWSEDEEIETIDDIVRLKVRRLVEAEIKTRVRRFLVKQKTAKRTMARDKVTFMAGTVDLWLSAYWLGAWPESFYKLYTFKAGVLFATRWIVYRYKRWHYYLLDLCYAAQLFLLLQLWVFPLSLRWIKMTFALNCGPLLWSVLAFRNSLVYHSLDKLTSFFLHWFPACVSWATRWYPSAELRAQIDGSPELRESWERADLFELMALPLVPYFLWAAAYYVKIFVISSKRIDERGYTTLFKYVSSSNTGVFGSILAFFPERMKPAAYMGIHVCLSAVTLVFNALWWRSQIACTIFLLSAFTASAWNGASFYFDIFSRRYISDLDANDEAISGRVEEAQREQEEAVRLAAAINGSANAVCDAGEPEGAGGENGDAQNGGDGVESGATLDDVSVHVPAKQREGVSAPSSFSSPRALGKSETEAARSEKELESLDSSSSVRLGDERLAGSSCDFTVSQVSPGILDSVMQQISAVVEHTETPLHLSEGEEAAEAREEGGGASPFSARDDDQFAMISREELADCDQGARGRGGDGEGKKGA